MEWRPIILNRFFISLSTITTVVVAWNIYVSFHNEGNVHGMVVDSSGAGVAGAEVILARKTVTSVDVVDKTTTDSVGAFTFADHGQYALVLTASSGSAESARTVVPLWFRNQDIVIDEPIVIKP